jgi:hypothetical protein
MIALLIGGIFAVVVAAVVAILFVRLAKREDAQKKIK